MNYVFAIYEGPEGLAISRDADRRGPYMGAWSAYSHALVDAGVMRGGAGLQLPETATTLRMIDERRVVQDGPFAEAKEQLAGFFVVDLPDLDTALDWAARAPVAPGGGVEVRPALQPPSRP